jgi:hypothetical protein
MKVIQPLVVTTAMLSASNVPETDYAEWAVGTAYVIGNRVIKAATHRIYECLVAHTGADPETNLTGVSPKWMDYAPTNRWAMFDNVVGTITRQAGTITQTLLPGPFNSLALLGVKGDLVTITIKGSVGGAVVYSKLIAMDATPIASLFDWFFLPYEQREDIILTDIPYQYATPELTVTVTAGAGNAECGVCKFGEVTLIGGTQYGATAGITDYSIKQADDFGNYSVVKRSFAKRATFSVQTEGSKFNHIFRTLAVLRATPCIWIGTEELNYEPLTIYGFYKDFSIDIAYPTTNMCSLEIEGLT